MSTNETRIVIVDYGRGNLRSVQKALEKIGQSASITCSDEEIDQAPAIIFPGVGAFGDVMRELKLRGIADVIRKRGLEAADGGRPFLGICLGMQVLVDYGTENGGADGLGIIAGQCPRLPEAGLKIPQMGWNQLQITQRDNPLFQGIEDGTYVYFVHSYAVVPEDRSVIAAKTDYGGEVTAALRKKNLMTTQFHPEKSQQAGLKMLENFVAFSSKLVG